MNKIAIPGLKKGLVLRRCGIAGAAAYSRNPGFDYIQFSQTPP